MIRIRHLAFAAAAFLLGVAATSPADAAAARCGMTIRGKVKLTQDLDCTGQRPPTLVGPRAHLDLNGFTLTCASWYDFSVSFKLRGQGALLRNGELFGCKVELLERGDHKVRFVNAEVYDGTALLIRSNSNEIVNSGFNSVEGDGASVASGNFNLITDSHFGGGYNGLDINNRTILVNSGLSGDNRALVIYGNFNRVLGNDFVEACISDYGSENVVEANTGGIPDRCEYGGD